MLVVAGSLPVKERRLNRLPVKVGFRTRINGLSRIATAKV
jgi:hypothetical protein